MSASSANALPMDLDNSDPTSGVSASMHAPNNTPLTNPTNSNKRSRDLAGLDISSDEEQDNDANLIAADLTENRLNIVTAPPHNHRFAIDGVHPRDMFFLLTASGRNLWINAPNNDNAVCAYIPGDKFPADGDPSATVRVIRNTAIYITQNNNIDVLPASPNHPSDGQGALYVICYITNLSESNKTTLLKFPLFCTPEGNIATFELDFIPNSHVGVWGRSCMTDDPNQVLALRETVKRLIMEPGSSIFRSLHRFNDRIPHTHNSSPPARASYIASTVEIIPINIKRREKDGSLTDHTCFNIYIESPTYNHRQFNQWLDNIGKHTFRTLWGTVSPVEPFLCKHCGSRAHPAGLCAYPTEVIGFQVRNAPNAFEDHHDPPNNTYRGGFRGRGRARGLTHRGRGTVRGRGH